MNQQQIIADIQVDPTIPNNIDAYVAAQNLQNQQQMVTQPIIIQQSVIKAISRAELNGGLTSVAEVQAAIIAITAAPNLDLTDQLSSALRSAFQSGDKAIIIATLQQCILACQNTITQLKGS